MLLEEYKHTNTNEALTAEINALVGDFSSLGHGWTHEALLSEIEEVRQEKLSAQQGKSVIAPWFYYLFLTTTLTPTALESAELASRSHLTRSNPSNNALRPRRGERGRCTSLVVG
jgi:hypothetical protein